MIETAIIVPQRKSTVRKPIERFGLVWPANITRVEMLRQTIRRGGQWKDNKGRIVGAHLFDLYRELQTTFWPEDDHQRWSDLGLKTIIDNDVSVFMGSSDSNKTYLISRYVICDWWVHSENTLWLISSTELRGAELRIWGVLKQLFNRARERFPDLPGKVLESHHAITTESISEDQSEGRLLTKGLIFIPCKKGGQWIGMGALAGIKPTKNGRLGHAGDEVSFMERAFLDAYANWYGKPNFKGIMSGNPFDMEDPLCIAGEPIGGWQSWRDTGKTQTWRSTFYNAAVVAYDGRDSPNMDVPASEPVPYPYIIGRKKIDAVKKTHGEDSWQFHNQCVGKPRPGAQLRRVLSRQLCDQHHAFDNVVWGTQPTTKVAACDAAYGGMGGDRCTGGHIEFGKDVNGRSVLQCHPPVLVPVSVMKSDPPEEQIAVFMRDYCATYGIPPQNFFFDGRGSLAVAFARNWSPLINSVEFGGSPTTRPVSLNANVWDGDVKRHRLQRCDELYSKFVTELWWSVHYIVVSDQMYGLPQEAASEFFQREWRYVRGNRIEVETKAEMRERTGRSPDWADFLVTAVEGARRLGFQIMQVDSPPVSRGGTDDKWKRDLRERASALRRSFTLTPT